jgi:hypothetical protein
MSKIVTIVSYLARTIADEQCLLTTNARCLQFANVQQLISHAYFGMDYAAHERQGCAWTRPEPIPYLHDACKKFDVDPQDLTHAVRSADTHLRFAIQSGAIERVDPAHVEIISPVRPTAFLVREKPARGAGTVGIFVAISLPDLFNTVRACGSPEHFEYAPLPSGVGVMFPLKAPMAGLGQAGIEAMVPKPDGLSVSPRLRLALDKTMVWFDLATAPARSEQAA